jgi:hypothetical protein
VFVAGCLFNYGIKHSMQSPAVSARSSTPPPPTFHLTLPSPQSPASVSRAGTDSPSLFRRCLPIAVPVLALASGAASYALASGANTDNYDQADTYRLNLNNGLIGAAGMVGGAVLPLLAACGRSVVRALCGRSAVVIQTSEPQPGPVHHTPEHGDARGRQGVELRGLLESVERARSRRPEGDVGLEAGRPEEYADDGVGAASTVVTIHPLPWQ